MAYQADWDMVHNVLDMGNVKEVVIKEGSQPWMGQLKARQNGFLLLEN